MVLLCFVFSYQAQAQGALSQDVNLTFTNKTIPEIFETLEETYSIRIYYDPATILLHQQSFQFEGIQLKDALKSILNGTGKEYIPMNATEIVVLKSSQKNKAYAEKLIADWKNGILTSPLKIEPKLIEETIGDPQSGAVGTLKVEGLIVDEESSQPIIGATLLDEASGVGAATDFQGRFTMEIPAGNRTITVQSIGYQELDVRVGLFSSGRLDLKMPVQPFSLDEVVVEGQANDQSLRATAIGIEALSVKEIRELPSLTGEADVLKSLETLPGISTVGEGTSGINVRGGQIDQNLILLNGGQLFNTSHALGFLSVFNADVVQEVNLYKGHIPAKYGGRLSSVLDVKMRDGNFSRVAGQGGTGFTSSRLTLEGPIARDKTSFLAAGRISHINWLLPVVDNRDVAESMVDFSDVTLRISHRFNEQQRLSISGLQNRDQFQYADEFGFGWQTRQLNVDWTSIWSSKWSSSLTGVVGSYDSELFDPTGSDGATFKNQMRSYQLQSNVLFVPNKQHQISAGIDYIRYAPADETRTPRGEDSAIAPKTITRDQGQEIAAYLEETFEPNDRWGISAGIRYTFYQHFGPNDVFLYEEGAPLETRNIIDTVSYGSGESIATYSGLSPRISLKYNLTDHSSVKLSFNRLFQFTHLLTNSAASTPADPWQVSNTHIEPKSSDNYSIGYFHNFNDNLWITSIQGYYKTIDNLLLNEDLPELFLNEHIETELLAGEGRAYGIETSIEKTRGRLTGQLSYTYSRSEARTPGADPSETINQGEWFAADFDQPHQINLRLNWKVNAFNSINVGFTYRTGRPVTLPTSSYVVDDVLVTHFSPRNQERIPDYHRFDIGYTFDKTKARRQGYRSRITVSLYNLYGRRNPFNVFFRRNNNNVLEAFQLSVLGSTLPAISYNFIF